MKKFTVLFLLIFSLLNIVVYSQCEPLTPEQCPDPENNGQICPDSLTVAFVGQLYSQVATIKPPATYMYNNTEIPLHHVKLMEVDNLPAGITWQSNTLDSIFTAGEYYCVLMEGTPVSAGEYSLRIVVDVYVFFGVPIYAGTVTDSTSLTIVVINDSGIKDHENASFYIRHNIPNPFQSDTRIEYYSEKAGQVAFEVYSMLGERVFTEQLNASQGENFLIFNGQKLPGGSYFYLLRSGSHQTAGIMIRAD